MMVDAWSPIELSSIFMLTVNRVNVDMVIEIETTIEISTTLMIEYIQEQYTYTSLTNIIPSGARPLDAELSMTDQTYSPCKRAASETKLYIIIKKMGAVQCYC